MKQSSSSKITAWIWRGAALLLCFYLLFAAVLDIPFFSTSVGFGVDGTYPQIPQQAVAVNYREDGGDGPFSGTSHNVLAFHHTLNRRDPSGVFVGYQIDIESPLHCTNMFAVAQNIYFNIEEPWAIKDIYLHCDHVTITGDAGVRAGPSMTVIGLKPPRFVDENGVEIENNRGVGHYIRSYSTAFLPVIDTGASPLGMIVLSLIPVFIGFLFGFLPIFLKRSPAPHKRIVHYGLCAKLLVFIFVFAVMESPVLLFYASPYVFPFDSYQFFTWLTPIISIPALSIWLASFKNKKLAPLVALGIMVLCLYQPLANLVCLFATVIAWGYFVEGIRRFFVRFKKQKAE